MDNAIYCERWKEGVFATCTMTSIAFQFHSSCTKAIRHMTLKQYPLCERTFSAMAIAFYPLFLAILPFSREGSFHTTLDYMCKKPLPVCCSMRCFNAYNIRCTGFIDLFFGVIVFFLWNFLSNFCHTATVIEFASFHSSLVWILLFEFINQDDSRTWHHRFVYQKYFDDFVYIREIARLIPSSTEFLKCMYQKNLFFWLFSFDLFYEPQTHFFHVSSIATVFHNKISKNRSQFKNSLD